MKFERAYCWKLPARISLYKISLSFLLTVIYVGFQKWIRLLFLEYSFMRLSCSWLPLKLRTHELSHLSDDQLLLIAWLCSQ